MNMKKQTQSQEEVPILDGVYYGTWFMMRVSIPFPSSDVSFLVMDSCIQQQSVKVTVKESHAKVEVNIGRN